MVNYRRNYIEGGTYFFTVTLQNRNANYLIEYIEILRLVIQLVRNNQPFKTIASVILPEHLHMIWKLPDGDMKYPKRWSSIKSQFTKQLVKLDVPLIKNNRCEYNLWQNRFWEHTIKDETDLLRHIDYIHYNPVKHGFVENVIDWPYSSFHQYVEKGILTKDWGSDQEYGNNSSYGE